MRFQAITEHRGGCCKVAGCRLSGFGSSPIPPETQSPGCLVASREQYLSVKTRVNAGGKTTRVVTGKSWILLSERKDPELFPCRAGHTQHSPGWTDLTSHLHVSIRTREAGPCTFEEGCQTWSAKAV